MKRAAGFTLVELMISLTLGLVLTGALVQVYQSNNTLQAYNYALSNIQQDGRYIVSAMRQSLLPVGNYNEFSAALDRSLDTAIESQYIKRHPIAQPNDFMVLPALGALNGENQGPDRLVVNLMASETCNGSTLDFPVGTEFHVVNEYYLDGNSLRCKGHDGRYLRGFKGNGASGQSVTLLDNVYDMQVLYGISLPTAGIETGFVTSWVTADRLAGFVGAQGNLPVVAIKLAFLIKNDVDLNIDNVKTLKLLDQPAFVSNDDGLYRVFETVIIFRSTWNNLRTGA